VRRNERKRGHYQKRKELFVHWIPLRMVRPGLPAASEAR
jgi:hypothetical protein